MKKFCKEAEGNPVTFLKKSGLLIGALTLLLSGCSVYQYVSVKSYLGKNDLNEYVVENDTATISYSFSGYNFPLIINLQNRLDRPLYIDTERSAVIINGRQINDAFYKDGQPRYVSAMSNVTLSSNPLMSSFIDVKKDTSGNGVVRKTSMGKVYSYDDSESPVFFRVILAITPNEDYSYPTFFDYSFWVSDILQTNTKPDKKYFSIPNQFYFGKSTGVGKFFGYTGVVLLVILGAMVAPE
jgi:hypothetical protein